MKNAHKLALIYLREILANQYSDVYNCNLDYQFLVKDKERQKLIEQDLTEFIEEIQKDAVTCPF